MNSFYFYKCVLLKKKYIYSFNLQPIFYFKAVAAAAKFNSFKNKLAGIDYSYSMNKSKRGTSRVFSIQKTFLNYKRNCVKKFLVFFKFFNLKRRDLHGFFSNFRQFNFNEITNFFSLMLFRLIGRIFPFFNFFFIKLMVSRGLVLVNFKKVSTKFCFLKTGDFVSFFFLKNLWRLIEKNLRLQSKHLFKVKKKLFALARVNKISNIKIKSKYFPKHFRKLQFFLKKTPTWVEVDYLSLSFFILKKKKLHSFFLYFNPFLYRLLEF